LFDNNFACFDVGVKEMLKKQRNHYSWNNMG
jgi:hypothetical protein